MKNLRLKNVIVLLAFGMMCALATGLIQPLFEEPIPPGVIDLRPGPADACGMPPSPEDWRVMRNDGTVDNEKSMEFAKHISEWDQCMTDYAGALYDYIFVLEGIRDSTIEAAGSYYQQFIDPTLQPPGTFGPEG